MGFPVYEAPISRSYIDPILEPILRQPDYVSPSYSGGGGGGFKPVFEGSRGDYDYNYNKLDYLQEQMY